MTRRPIALALALGLGTLAAAQEPRASAGPSERERALRAAREVIEAARYCTLVTLGGDGHPQARVVDPFAPGEDLTVWIATNPRTRKVEQVRKDPRVTLLYFDPAGQGYVTLLGRADVVDDPVEKAKRWKREWAQFYKDENRGGDYLLIHVEPQRLEVVSPGHGVPNDPVTWRPVTIELR